MNMLQEQDPNKPPNIKIDFEPIGRRIVANPGDTLLEASQKAGIEIISLCGGAGTCNNCRVRLISGQLSEITSSEQEELKPEERSAGWRLACQAKALTNVKINIPPESLTSPQRLQLEGREVDIGTERVIRAFDIDLEKPTLISLDADLTRIKNSLVKKGIEEPGFRFEILESISEALRAEDWQARVAIRFLSSGLRGEIVALLPVGKPIFGLAVDIGTTKLAAYLVNIETGEIVEKNGEMNPQISYGEDVVSRIAYSNDHTNGRKVLQNKLIGTLNKLIDDLCQRTGISREQILECVVVGNTVMHHLFAGLPIQQLGLLPFVPAVSEDLNIRAHDVGLKLAAGSYVYMAPNIAGYVGADHVAMILSTQVYASRGIEIAIDIGTNTEISLAARGKLICCSCASGPAFEGAHIHDGMRAAAGAIERVQISNGQVSIATIGGKPAIGICGSGIIDAVAEMYKESIIDYRGTFLGEEIKHLDKESRNGFVLVPSGKSGTGKIIIVTRKDINEVQLAKAAIRSGIDLLLTEAGVSYEMIDKFILAGAFGSYINIHSALAIGMFPPIPLDRFQQVGNAAGMGAVQLLLSATHRDLCKEYSRRIQYLELTICPSFQEKFIEAMYFPR